MTCCLSAGRARSRPELCLPAFPPVEMACYRPPADAARRSWWRRPRRSVWPYIVAALAALAAMIAEVRAQPRPAGLHCAPIAELANGLRERYGEAPVASAFMDDAGPVLFFASGGADGTWTMLLRVSQTDACVIATGRGWRPEGGRA